VAGKADYRTAAVMEALFDRESVVFLAGSETASGFVKI